MSPAPPERCTRRDAIRLSVAGALGSVFGSVFGSAFASALGCVGAAGAPAAGGGPDGRLTVRAAPPPTAPVAPGFHPLSLGDTMRDGVLYVPPGLAAAPAPLVLAFHGAGGQGARFARRIVAAADAAGVLLLAADSRGSTWDRIGGEFGPDVEFLARAVALAQRRRAVDTARLALAGFSDGASYALSLGLTNGDVFGRVIAFSPGFSAPGGFRGRPRLFVSHGTADAILPIERTSRRLVPELRGQGYDVTYREFEGPHTVPEDVARAAFGWLAGSWA